jgi:hypothetical protein
MRWDNLFDDLESQLAHELTAEEVDLQAEEERLRLARLGLRDRLFAMHKSASGSSMRKLRLELRDGSRITVVPTSFGRDWFSGELVEESGRRPSCVVPLDAIVGIVLGPHQVRVSLGTTESEEAPGALSARLGLTFVLRDLCRRRYPVQLHLGGSLIHGTIDRVGRDHLDLAVHEAGDARRQSAVTEYRVVMLNQLMFVRL